MQPPLAAQPTPPSADVYQPFDLSKAIKVTVSPKYQVVIPKAVRQELTIKPGDELYAYELNGTYTFRKIPTIEEVQKMLAPYAKAVKEAGEPSWSEEVIVDRKVDGLLDAYKDYTQYNIPLSFQVPEEYREAALERFDTIIPGGRAWYEKAEKEHAS